MQQTIFIVVSGIVQGVFYRQRTKDAANRIGISGEIKNVIGGNVQITATGTEQQLDEFLKWCWKGPETAVVSNVIVEKMPLKTFAGFKIVR